MENGRHRGQRTENHTKFWEHILGVVEPIMQMLSFLAQGLRLDEPFMNMRSVLTLHTESLKSPLAYFYPLGTTPSRAQFDTFLGRFLFNSGKIN